MPILFVSLNEKFAEKMAGHGFDSYVMKIQDFRPPSGRKTYYVSPANSLCFMDGGIDQALSRIIFPGIEQEVKSKVAALGRRSLMGRFYLPIGSSLIVDRGESGLVVAPTMLLPQDVSQTRNAYQATMAVLQNVLVNRGENLAEVNLIFTSMCCGWGRMSEDESGRQILEAIRDYRSYSPQVVDAYTILNEPNLGEQPRLYQNTEFVDINPSEIVRANQ